MFLYLYTVIFFYFTHKSRISEWNKHMFYPPDLTENINRYDFSFLLFFFFVSLISRIGEGNQNFHHRNMRKMVKKKNVSFVSINSLKYFLMILVIICGSFTFPNPSYSISTGQNIFYTYSCWHYYNFSYLRINTISKTVKKEENQKHIV